MKGPVSHSRVQESRPLCLAAGVFDGVHRGHQAVIAAALREARQRGGVCGILTFDRHPRQVVGAGAPSPLTNLGQKMALFRALGVEECFILQFTPAFANQSAAMFLERLRKTFPQWRMISVGAGWRFGKGGEGHVGFLRRYGERHGIQVAVVPPVCYRGAPISSTRIREALRRGAVRAAAEMLGRPVLLKGRVVRGRGLGRRLGFPTANLRFSGEILLGGGVYACRVRVGEREWRSGVMNVGYRPTVSRSAGGVEVEVHVLGFRGCLYGRRLEVEVIRRLRAERKFPDLEALRRQMAKDVQRALRLLGGEAKRSVLCKNGALQSGGDAV